MTSFVKTLTLLVVLLFPLSMQGKETVCYKLVSSSSTAYKTGSVQFVSFIGDQCYESDINGISTKNGTLQKNDYQSTGSKTVYNGSCFCGEKAKVEVASDRSSLTVTSNDGKKYHFTKISPPSGVTKSSLIRTRTANSGYVSNGYQPQPNTNYYPNYNYTAPNQNYNNNTTTTTNGSNNYAPARRKCNFCNGAGKRVVNNSVPMYGTADYKVRCNECGQYFLKSSGHAHVFCGQCGGTGWQK